MTGYYNDANGQLLTAWPDDKPKQWWRLMVNAESVLIESNYDLFPAKEYPVTDLVEILLKQQRWLLDHLPDRPAR